MWVEGQVAQLGDLSERYVLEVGSYDVNGSVRHLFDGCAGYVGIDHAAGPGVDHVMDACDLRVADESVGVVVSTEMLEHCLRPWVAVAEMFRVLAPGGILLLTCRGFSEAGSFPFHNPPDITRFSAEGLGAIALDAGFDDAFTQGDPQVPGWFMVARKSA